ncbi:hypothetical protein LAWI1_G002736 [Lachnellula willkommii]|uniref:Uncharacterized protein n=1 Tax=Lachnellula willkommii TaxID=215461 RepID=A0A559MGK2_9HELO|nr:hypothetical protein LAWI1_G002736 [Lachnellula willkommii]
MAVAGGNLHDNGIIEASAEPSYRPNTKRRQWENGSQAGRLTWKIARRHVIRPREELDRRSLHIGMMDLVTEGCSEDLSALGRCPGRTAIAARIGTA